MDRPSGCFLALSASNAFPERKEGLCQFRKRVFVRAGSERHPSTLSALVSSASFDGDIVSGGGLDVGRGANRLQRTLYASAGRTNKREGAFGYSGATWKM